MPVVIHDARYHTWAEPQVYDPSTGRTRFVKNLDWVLRHTRQIDHIEVLPWPVEGNESAVLLGVTLIDGRSYTTSFADRSVLGRWLKRPSLRGITIYQYVDNCQPWKGVL